MTIKLFRILNDEAAVAHAPQNVDAEIEAFAGPTKYGQEPPAKASDDITDVPSDKPTEEKQVEEPKVEDKKISLEDFSKILPEAHKLIKKPDETKKELEDPKKKTQQLEQPDNGVKKRDYTGFTEQEAAILKKTSNEAFEFVSARLKKAAEMETTLRGELGELTKKVDELKIGKTQIPDNYYENPESVYLTPEARGLQETIGLARSITNHWKQQVLNVETGADWHDLVQDPKTGAISIAPTPAACPQVGTKEWAQLKANLSEYSNHAQRQTFEFEGKLGNLVNNFKTRYEGLRSAVTAAEDTYMPMFKDTKSEDYKFVAAAQPEVEKLGISKSNPAFTILSKSIALNIMFTNLIKQMNSEQQIAAGKAADVKKAGPTTQVINNGGGSSVTKTAPSLNDFAAMGLPAIKL